MSLIIWKFVAEQHKHFKFSELKKCLQQHSCMISSCCYCTLSEEMRRQMFRMLVQPSTFQTQARLEYLLIKFVKVEIYV
uniref:Uncharacterized protein n=1 Tax=Kalanchoe fedtschenkoi TaxID=63787 RepID=A0A7N0VEV4_KALFE